MSDRLVVEPSRRALVKGAAWSVPAVAVATAAPAFASSVTGPKYFAHGFISQNEYWTSTREDGSTTIKTFTSPTQAPPPGSCGYGVDNTTSSTTISNITNTFWLAFSNLTWTANSKYSSSDWSLLTRDTTRASKTSNGTTFYAYTTTYLGGGSVAATSGTTCISAFAFESQGLDLMQPGSRFFYIETSALINGATQTIAAGPLPLT